METSCSEVREGVKIIPTGKCGLHQCLVGQRLIGDWGLPAGWIEDPWGPGQSLPTPALKQEILVCVNIFWFTSVLALVQNSLNEKLSVVQQPTAQSHLVLTVILVIRYCKGCSDSRNGALLPGVLKESIKISWQPGSQPWKESACTKPGQVTEGLGYGRFKGAVS